MAASILSTFDILKPLDECGTPIEPTMEYDFSLMLYAMHLFFSYVSHVLLILAYKRHPKPFKCRFQPRHEGVQALIRSNLDLS